VTGVVAAVVLGVVDATVVGGMVVVGTGTVVVVAVVVVAVDVVVSSRGFVAAVDCVARVRFAETPHAVPATRSNAAAAGNRGAMWSVA
jgi:hypothetical protein